MSELNVRQEKFCIEYAKSGNATQAYCKAGYSSTTGDSARAKASELLTNPNIKIRLKELSDEINTPEILTAQGIQEAYSKKIKSLIQSGDYKDWLLINRLVDTLNKMQGNYLMKHEIKAQDCNPVLIVNFDDNGNGIVKNNNVPVNPDKPVVVLPDNHRNDDDFED